MTRAGELAESWVNGNRRHVLEQVLNTDSRHDSIRALSEVACSLSQCHGDHVALAFLSWVMNYGRPSALS